MRLFDDVIREMDGAYISWSSDQQTKAKRENAQPVIPTGGKTKQPKPKR
jgi:hypothetical protein